MRKLLTRAVVAISGLLVLVTAALLAFLAAYPRVGRPPDVRVEPTPARIERGRYVALQLAGCVDCHSKRDWRYFSGPVMPGTEGMGGDRFGEELGLPGTFYAGNITPAALTSWTDGELIRAITAGVTKNGGALFPLMPYVDYCGLSWDDLQALISYLRAMPPIPHPVPASRVAFPMNLIVRTFPHACGAARPSPDPTNPVVYGAYLATGCADCHTPLKGTERDDTRAYAGGRDFPLPAGGTVRASNITPDAETGIGNWTEDMFVARFRMFAGDAGRRIPVEPGEFNTVMPWTASSSLTNEDLHGIYSYLRSVPPVRNLVTKFSPNLRNVRE